MTVDACFTSDRPKYLIKDPVSCLTHLMGCIASIIAATPMFIHAVLGGAGIGEILSLGVFMLSLILLYGASATYHAFRLEGKEALRLKKLDHMMIFILIAGSYTPFCNIVLQEKGLSVLVLVWGIAALGIIFKSLWVTCPRWVSSVMYITMGWVIIFEMPVIVKVMPTCAFIWLLAGGIIYTIGGIIYALKLVHFKNGASMWGSHEVFHLFVLAGSVCHYISLYSLF